MMNTPASSIGTLKTNQWDQLQGLLSRFERGIQDSDAADLARYLPPPEHNLRELALRELIKVDLEIRWKRKQHVTIEQYLARFPELRDSADAITSLLCEEYRARQLYGDRPGLDSYQQRFPEQFESLKLLVAEAGPLTPSGMPQPQGGAGPKVAPPAGSDYKFIKRIGSGSFGEVWRAEAPGGIAVAIKVIFRPVDHEEGKRDLEALELIKGIRHPFLMQTQAYWVFERRLYIVMELADKTLGDRLKECVDPPGIPQAELLHYIGEAAEALDYLHGQGVLHRDVKPDNLMVVTGESSKRGSKSFLAAAVGHVKVADFNLVRIWESQRLTASGSGTPAYMAPEVWANKVTRQSDQYSLAVTYAELRLGRRVFSANSLLALRQEHCEQQPNMSELTADEQQVILKALHKDPNKRYESCTSFANALKSSLRVEAPPAPRPSKMPLALGIMGALMTVALVVGAAAFWVWNRQPDFVLTPPRSFAIRADGQDRPLMLRLDRHNLAEDVAVSFSGLPHGITIPDATIGAGAMELQVPVQADWRVNPPGKKKIDIEARIRAQAGDQVRDIPLVIAVEPAELPYWQEDWQPADDARLVIGADKQPFFDHIDVVKGNLPVRFVLVPRRPGGPALPSFYIMQNKVSVQLFRQFATAKPEAISHGDWAKSGFAGPDYPKDSYPVFGVPAAMAHEFAQWLAPKKGRLPSLSQWDEAAGWERGKQGGPYLGTYDSNVKDQIAVGRRSGPMECGKATLDKSWLGCRDMAGNGYELTRTLIAGNEEVPLTREPTATDFIRLRGQTYAASRPLTFSQMEDPEDLDPIEYRNRRPDVGFRVVIEP
jgi:hypothetical protein